MTDPRPLMETLDEQACWTRLQNSEFGRLATAAGGQPDIFPINYAASGRSLLFRTAQGTKLAELADNTAVAFEIDHYDSEGGWSVVVRGDAQVLRTPAEIADAEGAVSLRPWIPSVKPFFVRITPTAVSGRRFQFDLDTTLEGTL
ncbi:pyridoxamine 5'-phosphate oxidase family protein [Agromyces seonyuensis]|uniref:Pyridoxamine 5'-phosphate oxidase family protein n=1 Tax=Agromyces seonyuensis TaxID=2662446 RepID=A0A6I4P0U4_9MICO|nr:pyridoxamine 5'-phosphate oxidase family protein [Agromyces seonyuensis]MWB99132.1 pyridoxamine 5'-phosphate oxidase family protein [Agromyces seonyuensis]